MKIQQKVKTSSRKRKPGKVETGRCAIYARCATGNRSAASIKRQISTCNNYAKRSGWKLDKKHIVSDVASGGSLEGRKALAALIQAAERQARPFDRILIDHTSRLSRNLADMMWALRQLEFNGVHVVAVGQSLDLSDPSTRQFLTLQVLMDEQYLARLREKIRRGKRQPAGKGTNSSR